MERYFTENPAIKAEFDKLPSAMKAAIIESGVKINSMDDFKATVKSLEKK